MKQILIVGLGGMIGAMFRYLISTAFTAQSQHWATMCINISGSLLIGIIFGLTKNQNLISSDWRIFLATGICGGFTTFSTFSHDNLMLLENGKIVTFSIYTTTSVLLGIIAVWTGYKLVS